MLTTRPRGTNDFLPGVVENWQYLENALRKQCNHFGYHEIRTPIFEHTELFLRSVGESSDIVEKEMYSFEDKGFRHLTLRPEGTAGTVRAFLENKLYANPQPTKLYYTGPMFRYDQPQAGRYRQFHQFGIEVLGSNDATIDAEVIYLAIDLFNRLGLKDLTVKLNTVGCTECRPGHLAQLKTYFSAYYNDLCPTCRGRLEKNPLRILDCKEESCRQIAKNAPTTIDAACPACASHFAEVKHYLDLLAVVYEVDTSLVRGLDYYTQTAFEVINNAIGSNQNAICGGGRYNNLLAECGGEDMPGIGFALGMERLLLTLAEQELLPKIQNKPHVFIASLGVEAKEVAFLTTMSLRHKNICCEMDHLNRSLKAQLKSADRFNVRYTIIIGENELANKQVIIRDMATSEQTVVELAQVVAYIEERVEDVTP